MRVSARSGASADGMNAHTQSGSSAMTTGLAFIVFATVATADVVRVSHVGESDLCPEVSDGALASFTAKTGVTETSHREAGGLGLPNVGLIATDIEVLVALECRGAFPRAKWLSLTANDIRDAGMITLADSAKRGAWANLTHLEAGKNSIGDSSMAAFAEALRAGALPSLSTLYLYRNDVSDEGLRALAMAAQSGALANLEQLFLFSNAFGDAGLRALVTASEHGALPALIELRFNYNRVTNDSVRALAAALNAGALPKLRSLGVDVDHFDSVELQAASKARDVVVR